MGIPQPFQKKMSSRDVKALGSYLHGLDMLVALAGSGDRGRPP